MSSAYCGQPEGNEPDSHMKEVRRLKKQNSSNASVGRDEQKKRRASLIKIGAVMILAFIVWVFSSIAWFSMNKTVSNSGIGVNVNAPPFELVSAGDVTEDYVTLFQMADSSYSEGVQQENPTNAYRTGSTGRLMWRLDAQNDGSSYLDGLRPGASGTLSFKIIPMKDDEFYVDCKFGIRAFTATYDEEDDEEETVVSLNEVDSSTGTADEKNAYRFINGHILFFRNRTIVSNKEQYSGYIGTDGLNVRVPANSSGVTVTVYWKWVNTLDQMLLKAADNGNDYPLLDDDNSADRLALINYIKSDYSSIFYGLTSSNQQSIADIDYAYVKSHPSFLSDLSENYNAADQEIGLNLRYFLIEMNRVF